MLIAAFFCFFLFVCFLFFALCRGEKLTFIDIRFYIKSVVRVDILC